MKKIKNLSKLYKLILKYRMKLYLNGGKIMEKIHLSIIINAPKEKVWDIMLGKDTYPLWTDVFMPGSYYIGDWSEGSKILFLAPDEKGKTGGIVSKIKENRPYEYISIEHRCEIEDGKEKEVEWAGMLENYTFNEINGKTEVSIDMDAVEEFKEMMQDMWLKALQKLKELAEK